MIIASHLAKKLVLKDIITVTNNIHLLDCNLIFIIVELHD